MALTELQTLEQVYSFIKEHGTPRAQSPGRFGGIWHADYWDLGDVAASLQDDGSTQAIISPTLQASSTYGRSVHYFQGSVVDLKALCLTYLPHAEFDF